MSFGRRGGPRRGTPSDYLVVGLGNPGREYRRSRHNAGAEAVELLAERAGVRMRPSKEAPALVAEARFDGRRVALAFPQTYMNDSGRAAGALVRRFGIDDHARIVIVHDELDLPPGRLKVKAGGGLAGHNGLRSLRDHLHTTNFIRVRIGVGKPPGGAAKGIDHVLAAPSKSDRELIDGCIVAAADAVEMIVREGVEAAMGRYNAA